MMKKILKGKWKIITALAVVVSFATVLAWHQMQNACAYDHNSDSEESRTFSNGYGDVIIYGPNNKQEWINVDFNYSGKKMTQDDFNNGQQTITVKRKDKEASGAYSAKVPEQTVKTSKNSGGNWTRIKFQIQYWQPEHEEYSWESADSVDSKYLGSKYQKASSNFKSQSGHSKSGHWVTVTINTSIYAVGLCTYYNGGKYNRVWNTAVNLGLQKKQYSVHYNGNGGTGADVTWNFTDGDNFTFPAVSRRGYTFNGWYDDKYQTWSNTGWIVCGENYTETAQWTANQYNVSFDDNGADSGNVDDITATYDSNFTLPQNGYKKKGYKFLGWSTNKNATSPEYTPGQTFTYKEEGTTTFYAIWDKSNFEVQFHGNGSSAADYTVDLDYNKSVNLPKNIFERPGYTFVGWVEDPKQDTVKPDYTDGQAVKDLCNPGETFDLFALWKKNDGSFETQNIIHDDKMFLGDINLTGQNGTGYSNANIDSKSAHIDTEDDPGYFTDRYTSNND